MRTPYKIATTLILLILVGASLYYYVSGQPAKYVIFASSQNMDAELREALINRLETNGISCQIDDNGNVKISEKDVEKAVVCCS
jgi:flagellar biosynthesis/type III secretory pathway M-ring protein FliF/YscJ